MEVFLTFNATWPWP